jgi:hypothetical protein
VEGTAVARPALNDGPFEKRELGKTPDWDAYSAGFAKNGQTIRVPPESLQYLQRCRCEAFLVSLLVEEGKRDWRHHQR